MNLPSNRLIVPLFFVLVFVNSYALQAGWYR